MKTRRRITPDQIAWFLILLALCFLAACLLAGSAHADQEPRHPVPLVDSLLGMMLRTAHPGLSPHSYEKLEACGIDAAAPTCDAHAPTCAAPTVLCRAPVYLDGAWRQVERAETARARFEIIARALADESAAVLQASKGKAWPGSAADFAVAMLAASYWSTGLREDIESGRTRGPAHEACLADLQPMVAWQFATFPHANLSAEQVSLQLVGTDYESLRRCYGAGLRALSAMRRWADAHCVNGGSYAGFAAYATGNSCVTPRSSKHGDVAGVRERLYQKFRTQLGGL